MYRYGHIVYILLYGFANVSGSGFVSTFLVEESIRVRIGNWEGDADTNTSNWIEFEYIVDGLERKGQEENLTGVTLFLYIGNSTVDFFV